MRRWLSIAIILAGTAAFAASPAKELHKVQQDLTTSKKNEAALAEKLADNARDLNRLSSRASNLAEGLQNTEERVSGEEDKAADIEAERAAKQKEFDRRREEYAETVASLLALQRIPPTAIFAAPEHMDDMLRTASILENTNKALADRAAELKRDMKDLAALKTRATRQQQVLDKEQTRLTQEQLALRKEIAARQEIQKKLAVDHEKAEARVAELSRKSSSLQDLLDKLARDTKKSTASSVRPARDFASAKGVMRPPVVGIILHHFGERKNENETWRGMVMRARPGGTVVAPYDGEVVFTGPFRDYGAMVLVRHSNGFISLLAGLDTIDVGLNQPVSKGEPVGRMPNTGGPELYIELRDRSKPIDPADWFANVNRRSAKS